MLTLIPKHYDLANYRTTSHTLEDLKILVGVLLLQLIT